MEPVSIQQAAMDAQNEIRAAMDRFIKTIEDSIVSPETFLDIEQLEREWCYRRPIMAENRRVNMSRSAEAILTGRNGSDSEAPSKRCYEVTFCQVAVSTKYLPDFCAIQPIGKAILRRHMSGIRRTDSGLSHSVIRGLVTDRLMTTP